MEKFKFTEIIDYSTLDKLIRGANDKRIVDDKKFGKTEKTVAMKKLKNDLPILKKMMNRVKNNLLDVEYKRASHNKGRWYAVGGQSLQSISKYSRHTLANDYYWDVDMDNAHPVILKQICEKHNIECHKLTEYVENREETLKILMKSCKCNRKQSKELMLRMMYLGDYENWMKDEDIYNHPPKFVIEFGNELKTIANEIWKIYPFIAEIAEKNCETSHHNKYSTCLSIVIQEIEDKALQEIVKVFEENGLQVDVLVFDGCMVRKPTDTLATGLNKEFLTKISKQVFEKIGYNLNISVKSMDMGFDLSMIEEEEECMDIEKLLTLEADKPSKLKELENEYLIGKEIYKSEKLKQIQDNIDELTKEWIKNSFKLKQEYFEKFHFKVMSPPCFGRIAYHKPSLWKQNELTLQYENCVIKDCNNNDKKFTDLWRHQRNIKTYEKVDFLPYPRECHTNTFNTFAGLNADRIVNDGTGEYQTFLDHINILVNKEADGFDYLVKWMAHLVQRPGELPRVSIVFKSEQGVGKNVFWELFAQHILGKEYMLQTAEMEKVVGRFSMVNNKLLVIMDETSGKDSFANSNKIKNLITAETIAWERKGIDGVDINNCGRYIIFSNNDTPVKIEMTDRRFVVYECSSDKRNNKEYFKHLVKSFKNENNVRAFYDYLMSIDIKDWDSINDRPITKAYRDIQSVNIPVVARFLDWYINEYGIDEEDDTDKEKISSKEFYQLFNSVFIPEKKLKNEYSSNKFGREMNKFEGITKVKGTGGLRCYHIDIETLKKYLIEKGFMEDWGDEVA